MSEDDPKPLLMNNYKDSINAHLIKRLYSSPLENRKVVLLLSSSPTGLGKKTAS